MNFNFLTSITNTTGAPIAGIPALSSLVVFNSPTWVLPREPILAAIISGALVAKDLSGGALDSHAALEELGTMADRAFTFNQKWNSAPSPVAVRAVQVAWNLEAAISIMATIRADMIVTSLASCGTSAATILAKLQGAVTLVGLGMFAEASATLSTVAPDGFLTSTRIALYQAMLTSADAIR